MADKKKLHQILSSFGTMQEVLVDYDKLNTMLDDALSKETKDSWNERLDKDEEPISEDLGEYINELSKQFPEVSFAKLSRIAVRVAKWQKEQMMKDVIDTQVVLGPNNNHVLMNGLFNSYKYHDKVKVALIKED